MKKDIEVGAYFYPITVKYPVRRHRARVACDDRELNKGLKDFWDRLPEDTKIRTIEALRSGSMPTLSIVHRTELDALAIRSVMALSFRERLLQAAVPDEIRMTREAVALFPEHEQPRVYALDPETTIWDDSEENALRKQTEMAAASGLDFFVFDSYEGLKNGVPIVEAGRPVELFRRVAPEGLKYAKMHTFASSRVVLPVSRDPKFYEPDRVFDFDRASVEFVVDRAAVEDWEEPNYLRVGDRPYVSIFVPDLTPGWDGSQAKLNEVVDTFKEYSQHEYGIDPYIVGSIRTRQQAEELTAAGADALTGYAFLPSFGDNVPPIQNYNELLAAKKIEWDAIGQVNTFVPPAVVGWDASPRGKSSFQLNATEGHAYAPIVVGNTPESFGGMLQDTLNYVERNIPQPERYGIVCAWNEIGEGAALLPQQRPDGSIDRSYLDAVQQVVFNRRNR